MSFALSNYLSIKSEQVIDFDQQGTYVTKMRYRKEIGNFSVNVIKGIALSVIYALSVFVCFAIKSSRTKLVNLFKKSHIETVHFDDLEKAIDAHKAGLKSVISRLERPSEFTAFTYMHLNDVFTNSDMRKCHIFEMLNALFHVDGRGFSLSDVRSIFRAMIDESTMLAPSTRPAPSSSGSFHEKKNVSPDTVFTCYFPMGKKLFQDLIQGKGLLDHPLFKDGAYYVLCFGPSSRKENLSNACEYIYQNSHITDFYLDQRALVAVKIEARHLIDPSSINLLEAKIEFKNFTKVLSYSFLEYTELASELRKIDYFGAEEDFKKLKHKHPAHAQALDRLKTAYNELVSLHGVERTQGTRPNQDKDLAKERRDWMEAQLDSAPDALIH
ncbi:MAG: hypothetical protein MRY21_02230 [Simkaniaceae bacterium]|nr:hypothetical protein [Simkaniaceae bacterium]